MGGQIVELGEELRWNQGKRVEIKSTGKVPDRKGHLDGVNNVIFHLYLVPKRIKLLLSTSKVEVRRTLEHRKR